MYNINENILPNYNFAMTATGVASQPEATPSI